MYRTVHVMYVHMYIGTEEPLSGFRFGGIEPETFSVYCSSDEAEIKTFN